MVMLCYATCRTWWLSSLLGKLIRSVALVNRVIKTWWTMVLIWPRVRDSLMRQYLLMKKIALVVSWRKPSSKRRLIDSIYSYPLLIKEFILLTFNGQGQYNIFYYSSVMNLVFLVVAAHELCLFCWPYIIKDCFISYVWTCVLLLTFNG